MTGRPADPPAVRVRELTKSFPVRRGWWSTLREPLRRDRTVVLHDVSLDIPRGEFFGLLGPNGAGKTTLFKILATLILPESGGVEVGGVSAIDDPAAVRRLLTPVIADERSLNWRLTGTENLELFAALYGVPRSGRDALVGRTLETVGLPGASGRMVGTYSSGMKQRLLIARALLSHPTVLLLDEPTRSLDPVSARDFRRFLREEVAGRQGCTVLLATHDADEALGLCDRLAILDRGRVVAQGTARDLAGVAGEQRFRVLVRRDGADAALRMLGHPRARAFAPAGPPSAEGWVALEGEIPGGADASADVLRTLNEHAIEVAEFARIPLPLADMIERLVARGSEP